MILRISEEELSVEATVDRSKRREDGKKLCRKGHGSRAGNDLFETMTKTKCRRDRNTMKKRDGKVMSM